MPATNRHLDLPHRQAWQLAWPMILSNISVPLMGLADTAMLGHLDSPIYLGAVAVGANLLALLYWMFAFLRMSTTALTGQAYGAEKSDAISAQLAQAAGFALIPALLLIAAQALILPFALGIMAEDDLLRNLSLQYCEIRIYSAPAVFLTYVIIGWLIGLQNTRLPLVITVVSNLLNLLLDYLLIVKFGWAHKGAAIATLAAEYSALAIGLFGILHLHRDYVRSAFIKLGKFFVVFRPKEFFSLNTDLFIRTSVLLLVFNFLIIQSASQGELTLAVNAIILQLMLFVAFALDGYAHAAETMIAQSIGANNRTQFYRASIATSFPAIIIALFLSLGFYLFDIQLIHLMTDQLDIQQNAKLYFYWLYLLPLISVGCYMLDGIFIGAGQTRLMLMIMLVSVILFFLVWWLLRPYGNHGLWAAFTLFNFCRTSLMSLAYYSLSKDRRWFHKEHKAFAA